MFSNHNIKHRTYPTNMKGTGIYPQMDDYNN